jgi:hypothetical protein
MPTRTLVCTLYALTALVAFIGTWSQNVAYFHANDGAVAGFVLATARFWPETLATPASTSITVDLGLFFLAAAGFMVLEARRLGIRFVWAYVVLGLLVAISVTFPLFLIARERRLAAQGRDDVAAPGLTSGDAVGLAALGAAAAGFTAWTTW